APAGDVKMLVARAVRAEHRRKETARLLGRLDDDRARAIAEEDASSAVGVINEPRQGIGADDEDAVVGPGLDELRADGERVDEPGARRAQIERAGVAAQLRLDEARLRDEELVWGARADDDE